MLVPDIAGHRKAEGRFDADGRALQQTFPFDALAPVLTEAHLTTPRISSSHLARIRGWSRSERTGR